MRFNFIAATFAVATALSSQVAAHMYMDNPPPRGFQGLKGEKNVDYDIMSPATKMCQGKTRTAPITTVLTAGQTTKVRLVQPGNDIITRHDGGHCQFAISYDGGKTFVVLKTVEQRCIIDSLNYDVPIPASAPSSSNAIFAWTWINATGNREYYMNCADVIIKGKDGGSITGPKLLVVNILGGPTVPEWGYTKKPDPVGPKLLAARPTITVTASGSSTPAPPATGGESGGKKPDTEQGSKPGNNKPGTKPGNRPGNKPGNKGDVEVPQPGGNGSGACTNGEMKCSGQDKFTFCGSGLLYTMPCSPGTKCQASGNIVTCA